MANFDPIRVRLEGSNIVEASAGTGKTFSIGLLVLRLLMEKKIPIEKILMVTFTNAAVAELAARIRLFIAKSIKVIEGGDIKEEDIRIIVEQFKDEESLTLLRKALSDLDEASIQTIHSFCQDSLNMYALDSGQPFGLELQPDVLAIANDAVKNFWREHITGLPEELLREIEEISFENFEAVVRESIGGKKYAFAEENTFSFENYWIDYTEFKEKYQASKESIILDLKSIEESFGKVPYKNKEKLINLCNSFKGYQDFILAKKPQYYGKITDHFFSNNRNKAIELKSKETNSIHTLFQVCIKQVNENLRQYLEDKHLITYDELINRMHTAIVKEENEDLQEVVKDKYAAVFIDEFQDTDKLQYEIYNTLFSKDKILFYIGDPKQSIYAWRKADLHTYFQAKKNIPEERHYQMDKNYRSSASYVSAMEEFYSRCNDPFHTNDSELDLKFLSVEAHQKSTVGLKKSSDILKALQVFDGGTKAKIKAKVPKLVVEILNGEYRLNAKKVAHSDIGILVRTNKEAKQLKGLLATAGVHAITIDDAQVFKDSQEAKSLRYILQAVLETSETNINKALLNSFTGKNAKEVAERDKEELLDIFRGYREKWYKSGVYPMMKDYLNDFEVMRYLLGTADGKGLRVLTNLTQILELLQEAEYRQELKPLGLYEYLGKQIAGELQEGDEYQQRMESDEDAVKILTIHKAKGLEYPIVIAPFLDLKAREENYMKTLAYREEEATGEYKFYCKSLGEQEQKELYIKQQEQENRRLLYVALTRAKYNCFLFKTSGRYAGTTCLTPFMADFDSLPCLKEPLPVKDQEQEPKLSSEWGVMKQASNFSLSDQRYGKLSFSALSAHAVYMPKDNDGIPAGYEEFIFKTIPGGVNLGTMLHYLFENIDFQASREQHKEELDKLLDRYYPGKKEELTQGFLQMIDHVLDACIKLGENQIKLRSLANFRKRNEMEFDLGIEDLDLAGLKDFDAGEGIEINCKMQIPVKEGLLNGLIDLFFEYEGKYYILDWKSNYLGDDLTYYQADQMTEAMNEGNYHLQYYIYTLAVKKYLEQRLPNFDYERDFGGAIYVYLRGARADENTGIYTHKPTLEELRRLENVFCNVAV